MSYTFSFEKLEIWQLAIQLSAKTYRITKAFPSEEKFGLISQIRRASNSVSANIAEGMSRTSKKDRARFVQIAYGSAIEVMSHMILSKELEFVEEKALEEFRTYLLKLTNKINAFHKSLLK